jgi:hypothetical protein
LGSRNTIVHWIMIFRIHRASHHGFVKPQSNICDSCGKSCLTPSKLTIHLQENHPTPEDLKSVECKCYKCNQGFQTSLELNQHQQTCFLEKDINKFECKLCEQEETRTQWVKSRAKSPPKKF